ncbi:MAG TPA: hypothetical protein VMF91_04495 [Bryobacteraceae bacterium]|nr:hypothetical protein [Bryobacteraceae bacterium]
MEEREMIRRWVETWKDAGPHLQAVRHQDIERADTQEALAVLESAFNQATRTLPPRSSSGLVEMQYWFAKLRL